MIYRLPTNFIRWQDKSVRCKGNVSQPALFYLEYANATEPKRDVTAAKAFFQKAIKSQGRAPRTITLDGYAASHRAVHEMKRDGLLPGDTKLRSSKYLNNLIEQDHRHIKSRVHVMLGFKRCKNASVVIAGIELMHRIRKGQFDIRCHLKETAAPAVWNAVLSAS